MGKNLKNLFGKITGLDQRSLESLTNALEKSNLPGFDYIEFKQSVDALTELGMDEPTAFKSAFTTATTIGLTKDKLITTAKHYREVLSREKQQFEIACENQIEQKVNSKKKEVEKLKNQIEDYKSKIRQLEEQITKSQDTIDHADENIQSALERIKSTQSDFDNTFQSVVNQLDKDLTGIETYL